MSDNEMRERLREFSVAEIKKIIRKHNLHAHIKLGQKKEALIENIITHYKSAGDGSVLQMKHQDEIKLDEYTPTKTVITVRNYKKGAGDRMKAEKNKRADDLIQVLNEIKADKNATDKVVSDAKAEIERLKEAKAVRNKQDDDEMKKKADKAHGMAELIKSLNKIKSDKKNTESEVARAKMEIADLKETASRYDRYNRSDSDEEPLADDDITVEEIIDKATKMRYLAQRNTGNVYDYISEKPIEGYKWNFDTKTMKTPTKKAEAPKTMKKPKK